MLVLHGFFLKIGIANGFLRLFVTAIRKCSWEVGSGFLELDEVFFEFEAVFLWLVGVFFELEGALDELDWFFDKLK